MKQGTSRKLKPKPKQEKASWKKRNLARAEKQVNYADDLKAKREVDAALALENAS